MVQTGARCICAYIYIFTAGAYIGVTTIMEKQLEKNMENAMELLCCRRLLQLRYMSWQLWMGDASVC